MCVLVIRTWRCRGAPPRLPFFLELEALGARVCALVTCRPSGDVPKLRMAGERGEGFTYLIQAASVSQLRLGL